MPKFPPPKRLLVTGASGFLGWHICRQAPQEWEIFGLFFSHTFCLPGIKVISADLRQYQDLKKLFQTIRPHAVIHAAAYSDPNFCQLHPEETRVLNVETSLHLAALSADFSIPCLFTSSDLVFDGRHAPYSEEDFPNPINRYGEQKTLAEEKMRTIYPQTIICRLPLMFGEDRPPARSFLQPMLKAAKTGQDLPLFIDEFRTPVSGKVAALGLFLALRQAGGIFHLGGRERISRYEFGLLLIESLGGSHANLIPCLQKNLTMAAPRPADVSLNSEKAFSLGYAPPRLKEALREIVCANPSL